MNHIRRILIACLASLGVAFVALPLKAKALSPVPVSAHDADDDNTIEYVLGIGSLVLGAGAVVGGVAMILAANSESDSADALAVQVNVDAASRGVTANACANGPITIMVPGCDDLAESRGLEDTLTSGAVAMMIVGGALAVTGGVLVGIAATSDTGGDIAVVLSPTGLRLKGTF